MYPNSMDEILACTMDQSPQNKWDARANLQSHKREAHVSRAEEATSPEMSGRVSARWSWFVVASPGPSQSRRPLPI